MICALLIALIAFPDGVVPSPFESAPALFKRIPALVLLVVLWAASLRRTWRALRGAAMRHPLPLGRLP